VCQNSEVGFSGHRCQRCCCRPVTKAVPLHKTTLSPRWLRYSLTNRGGLSAKDDLICWSAIDRVLCGRLTSSGRVTDVTTVLIHETFAANICRVPRGIMLRSSDNILFSLLCSYPNRPHYRPCPSVVLRVCPLRMGASTRNSKPPKNVQK